MPPLPAPVLEILSRLAVEQHAPAFLRLDSAGRLAELGGELGRYGLAGLRVGEPAEEQVVFLAGLSATSGPPVGLPRVETAPGHHADVHVYPNGDGAWVVLLDRSEEVAERRVAQQLANDMSRIREAEAGALGERLRLAGAPEQLAGYGGPDLRADRGDASVLFARVRGLARLADGGDPAEVFAALNLYARAMVRPVLDEGGLADWTMRGAITAVFGMLPSSGEPARLAVAAALRLLAAVAELNASRGAGGLPALEVAAGVASGQVAVGLIGRKGLRRVGAVGAPVDTALMLEGRAGPGELLVDRTTFEAAADLGPGFAEVAGGGARPISAYSCVVA